jgi:hypothetical protein
MAHDKYKVPTASKGDVAHTLVKAGLSAVPIYGGPAAELFQLVIQPPLERRRLAWMEQVGEKLKELEDKGFDLGKLQNDERFISAVMHASQLALRTHQKAKLEALRNAILNVAKGQSPDEALQHMFLDFVDSLSELHLRILRLFQAPPPSSSVSMAGLNFVLEQNIPELRGRREVYDQFWNDLRSRGLVDTVGLHTTASARDLEMKHTSNLGDAFLKFISESK